jgi:hypothetical protein
MTELWNREWARWLAGLIFGAVLGWALFIVGILAVLIAVLTLLLAIFGRWQLAFVSGWVIGIGAMLLWLMVGVVVNCSADPTCAVSSGTRLWIGIGLGFVLIGTAIGLAAWRRKRLSSSSPA